MKTPEAQYFFEVVSGDRERKFEFLGIEIDWDLGSICTNYDICVNGVKVDGGYKEEGHYQKRLQEKIYQIAEKLLVGNWIKKFDIYLENIGESRK